MYDPFNPNQSDQPQAQQPSDLQQHDDQQQQQNSYVDSYQPPMDQPSADQSQSPMQQDDPTNVPHNDFQHDESPAQMSEPTAASAATPSSSDSVVSQALEDQNIFYLLGAQDGTDEEKEAFLDELQQVIWEDFLENDVELLVTEEEKMDLDKIMARKDLDEAAMQEEIVIFLEKLVPDLEEIMLEKALELKEDMVRERIAGMREYYAGKESQLATLARAEELINDGQWRDAAAELNDLQEQDQRQA